MSGTITLHSSQFPTGMPLVIELLDAQLNRAWQGVAIVNQPAPFPVHLATRDSVVFVALPPAQNITVPLKDIAGEASGALAVALPSIPERAVSLAGDWRSSSNILLDKVWVRLWSRDVARNWRVRRWSPSFQIGADGSASSKFRAGELRSGQHFLQIGTALLQPRMTAIPIGSTAFMLRPDPRRSDEALDVAVDVDAGSPGARMMLRYLSNGDLGRARIVGDTLLLAHLDQLDSTTALVGGYYLLACRDMEQLDRLLTTSLSKWGKWLSDVAVIAGWSCLRRERPDAEQAREHFLDASRCGVPIYSRGLRLLVDGLRLIMTDGALRNEEVESADKRLRKFAGVADWRTTFTTFLATHPNKPINSAASMHWLTDTRRAISDPLSLFPWASESPAVPLDGDAARHEFGSHISAAFSRAFASPPGNVGAVEAYKAFNEGITNLYEATQ